jgi:hypothetical protein
LPITGHSGNLGEPWEQQEGHVRIRNQMTESTLQSVWSCSWTALAFQEGVWGDFFTR